MTIESCFRRGFVAVFLGLAASLVLVASAASADCPPPAPDQQAVVKFVDGGKGCYRANWPADKAPRVSGAVGAADVLYSVHDFLRVWYSPVMARWMEVHRSDGKNVPPKGAPIPEGAAMVAEIYTTGAGEDPSGILVMVRQQTAPPRPDDPLTGWFWSQVVLDAGRYHGTVLAESRGESSFGLCIACHSSAVNNQTFATYTHITDDPVTPTGYQPRFAEPTTATLLAQVTPPKTNELKKPLGDANAKAFTDFYNQAVPEFRKDPLPSPGQLPRKDIVSFPPRYFDHAYLSADGKSSFVTADQCQGCHDTTAMLLVRDGNQPADPGLRYIQPAMAFRYNPQAASDPAEGGQSDLFNISPYGEWSVSIMGLAGRDPVFHSQAETERVLHEGVDPSVIDNVCYRCHGSMGQRQFHLDQGGDPTQVPVDERSEPPFSNQKNFNHFMIYSTPESPEHPVGDKPPYDQVGAQRRYARYGALARDGISCLICHHMGPEADEAWNGKDWKVFYGYEQKGFRELEEPEGFDFPFTSTFAYDLGMITVPPADLNRGYVGAANQPPPDEVPGTVSIYGHRQNFEVESVVRGFLPETEVCAACHVVIVPKIPQEYPRIRNIRQIQPDGKILPPTTPDGSACPPPPVSDGDLNPSEKPLYDPTVDPCVDVSYEQTTYFEWASSATYGGASPQTSCTFCHMPDAQGRMLAVANIDAAGSSDVARGTTSDVGAFPEVAYRADDEVKPAQNAGYARHRLMGINLHVHEMFQQFPDILGLAQGRDGSLDTYVTSSTVNSLLNAEESILTHAPTTVTLAICVPGMANTTCDDVKPEEGFAVFRVAVSNNAGHRFPTGAGFRRGFLELRLSDAAGKTLWVSGAVNPWGAVVDGKTGQVLETEFPPIRQVAVQNGQVEPGFVQPHFGSAEHPFISRQDQVQVYEVRAADEFGRMTTSTLRLFQDVKDNRIPPAGWIPPVDCQGRGSPGTAMSDPTRMVNGLDQVTLSTITRPDERAFTDPDYCTPSKPDVLGNLGGISGTDYVLYKIPLSDLPNGWSQVRAVMHYQVTPPYFLRDRFLDGQEYAELGQEGGAGFLGSAMERLLYVSSRLETRIQNSIPEQFDLPADVSKNWTMDIGFACYDQTTGSQDCPYPTLRNVKNHPERRVRGGK